MSILIDPAKSHVDATRDLASEQARLARAQEKANELKELEIILSTMTKEEQKTYLLKRQESQDNANALTLKIVIGFIIVITIFILTR